VHTFALRQRIQLQHAFENVRVRQQRVNERSKDKYDLGACPRTFKVGDLVRTLNRSLNVNSKFKEKWSTVLYKVQRVLGINLESLHPQTNKTVIVHHDKVSNPIHDMRDEPIIKHDESYRPDLHTSSDSEGSPDEEDHENHHDPIHTGHPENSGSRRPSETGEPENHSGDPVEDGSPEPQTQTETQTRTSQRTIKNTRNKDFAYYG
jgi:hypothetical protein